VSGGLRILNVQGQNGLGLQSLNRKGHRGRQRKIPASLAADAREVGIHDRPPGIVAVTAIMSFYIVSRYTKAIEHRGTIQSAE
jgi:hypothetical protein